MALSQETTEKLEAQEAFILQMQHEVLALTTLVQTFSVYGPTAVREKLDKIENTMQRYHEIAVAERGELAKEQTKHGARRNYQYPGGLVR